MHATTWASSKSMMESQTSQSQSNSQWSAPTRSGQIHGDTE